MTSQQPPPDSTAATTSVRCSGRDGCVPVVSFHASVRIGGEQRTVDLYGSPFSIRGSLVDMGLEELYAYVAVALMSDSRDWALVRASTSASEFRHIQGIPNINGAYAKGLVDLARSQGYEVANPDLRFCTTRLHRINHRCTGTRLCTPTGKASDGMDHLIMLRTVKGEGSALLTQTYDPKFSVPGWRNLGDAPYGEGTVAHIRIGLRR
ncbi:hypothetical protein GCG21_09080 [Pseudactinotalea sp. HY160]|uniref:hypothetical protein n=1 Tax=Pseudactinotalea sp. HY160 TaxID=2654490 RepID=UPI00128D60E0|nr:hypothetical protein [Pseudactinotalea sp. HY160]MPV50155.1 hypothetical protein [Pseudactinotalea sp. HY160]